MSATAYDPALREAPPARVTRVSWGAILAGALVAFVVVAMLHVLGLAAGLTAVDAVDRDTPDAGTFAMGAAAWSVASHLIGLAAGGYVAARLSGGVEAALHGLGVWATATVVSALMIGNLAAGAANTAGSALSSVLGGLGRGAGQAVSAAAEQLDPEQLVERARLALTAPAEPARMTTEQRAAEITSIIGQRVAEGRFAEGRRERLNALVAAEAGLPPEEAARRVAAYEAEAQRLAREGEERARRAADAAASAAARGAMLLFVTLLLGAVAAMLGAGAGRKALLRPAVTVRP